MGKPEVLRLLQRCLLAEVGHRHKCVATVGLRCGWPLVWRWGAQGGVPSSSRSHTLPSRSSIPVGVASFAAASSVLAAALRDILASAAIDEELL